MVGNVSVPNSGLENLSVRRTHIRAGAVSGPWRGSARPGGIETRDALRHTAAEGASDGDIRAPILRNIEEFHKVDEEITRWVEQEVPEELPGEYRPVARRHAPASRSPVLGAVVVGSLIAASIVALAFFVRPTPSVVSASVPPTEAPEATPLTLR